MSELKITTVPVRDSMEAMRLGFREDWLSGDGNGMSFSLMRTLSSSPQLILEVTLANGATVRETISVERLFLTWVAAVAGQEEEKDGSSEEG